MKLWFVIAILLAAVPERAGAVVLINEVLADPAGDANKDGVVHATQDEFVELVNTGSGAVALDGWTLSDALQVRRNFDAAAVIPAFGLFVTFGGLSLNNTGDAVTLRDAGGLLIDALTFGAEGGQDASLVRSPDAAGAFILHTAANGAAFSPGLTLDGRTSLPHSEPGPELPPDREPGPPPLSTVPEPSSIWLLGLGLSTLLTKSKK